ncbi:MAG: DUF5110 domain-containing protein [Caldilineaceae bacterium]|nr:DUF5110 domain-containing protein [Caldilineaceae bacterium]
MSTFRHTILPDTLLVDWPDTRLALTVYAFGVVRVRFTRNPEFSRSASLMVVAQPDASIPFSVEEEVDRLCFATAELTIQIDRATGALTYRDRYGTRLTREPAGGGKSLLPVDVAVSVFDDAAVLETGVGADGVRVRAQNVRTVVDRQAYQATLAFDWAADEALYGLGSHEEGILNLRGQRQHLYQQNMKAVVPVLVSTRGYGILLECYSLMRFHDDEAGSFLWADVVDELDFYFVHGPDFDRIVHHIRALTGAATMLPKWTFGYIQSKERYVEQAELLQVVREYRARRLPLDCIVLDWKSWTGDLWGQKTLDPDRFPDPDGMTAALHALHARLMISIWPTMKAGGANWHEMSAHGYLLGNQATYDAFNPAARACYWRQARDGLFAHGIDAWWCDCTEPFEADWRGPVKPEPEERLRINVDEAKRYLDPQFINAYSLLHSEGIYAGQRAATDRKRVLNLTRSAYLGQQRYGAITWSGDTAASWETLRRQIAEGLNFCATGLPYWTLDVGAFFVKRRPEFWFWAGDFEDGVDDLGYRELFLRWFQLGVFLPMLRAHGTDTPRELWRFGAPGEPVYDALVKFLHLRYRLLPYLYSLAGWTTQSAYTMLRLLAFDFRADPVTYDIRDQFMCGPALLVNPVTTPMHYAAGSTPVTGVPQSRPVYLPAGNDWVDFWTDTRHAGGQTITAAAPLEIVPLFVRAGAIVPLAPPMQYVDELANPAIELHVYPGRDGTFLLYEDAGDGYGYEAGEFSTIDIQWHDGTRRLRLGARTGAYPGMPARRTFLAVLHDGPGAITSQEIDYAGAPVDVVL